MENSLLLPADDSMTSKHMLEQLVMACLFCCKDKVAFSYKCTMAGRATVLAEHLLYRLAALSAIQCARQGDFLR